MQNIKRSARITRRPKVKDLGKHKAPENLFQLVFQFLNRVGPLRKVLLAIIFVFSGCVFLWNLFPDQGKQALVDNLLQRIRRPAPISYPGVEIEQQDLRFDLSERVAAQAGANPAECCKVTTDEFLTCRRVQKDAVNLARHAATTGATPTFFSQTHQISVQQASHERMGGPRMTDYDILLNISGEPLGRPFTAHLRSVRFGSFRNESTEWAAAAVLQPTRILTIEVRFPGGKPARNFRFTMADESDGSNYVPIDLPPQIEVGKDIIKWTIASPKLGYTYRLDWDW